MNASVKNKIGKLGALLNLAFSEYQELLQLINNEEFEKQKQMDATQKKTSVKDV
jgi:hypothetical protein